MNVDTPLVRVEMAQKLGLDVTDMRAVRDFIAICRFIEYKLRVDPESKLSDWAICEQLLIPRSLIAVAKNSRSWQIALQVMLAEFLDNQARSDARNHLFGLYAQYFDKAMRNMLQVATGEVMRDNQKVAYQPAYRDQVAAFTAIVNNPIGQAWMANTFLGETGPGEEAQHLALREKLLHSTEMLQLDASSVESSDPVIEALPSAALPAALDPPVESQGNTETQAPL